MKSKSQTIFKRIICVVLVIAMLCGLTLTSFAQANANEKQYVKDIQLIYAKSKSEARSYVPNGYTLLEYDLNEGTDEDYQVYIAYLTTANPDEAITDIKMMNMNGGFVLSDYEDQLTDVKENVKELANDVKSAVEMFAVNYEKGTYGAKAAYRALSAFTVDEADDQNLADYFLYGNPTDVFYVKLILNAHQNVLSSILSALAMAVQGEAGDTWLDRLAQIEDPWDVEEEPEYWDMSNILGDLFIGFYNAYNKIDHDRYRNGDTELKVPGENDDATSEDVSDSATDADINNNGIEALYEVAYMALEQYSFGTGETFAEWFVSEDLCEYYDFEMLYCLLEVMTPEEYAMMRLCGPLYMILATGMDEDAYNDYVDRLQAITGGEPVCSIWAGINAELFRSSIGVTDEAARAIAETEFEQGLNNEGDSTMDAVLKTAGLIAACGAVALGVGIITYYGFGSLMLSCFGGTVLYSAVSSMAVVGTIFGAVASVLGVTAIVAALVIAVVYLVTWVVEWYKETHPEYTDIPAYMYDYVTDGSGNSQFVLYEGVKFQDDRVADVNVWKGREWHAMYVSRDKAAGAPIEAGFVVRHGDGRNDAGYAGLASFGHVNAENMNQYAFEDEVSGIYVTYPQEDRTGDYARGRYLSDVKLFSNEDPEKCKVELKNENYVHYNVNLTPNSEKVTYLGYKTTNNVSRALTDIRVAYGYSSAQYAAGGGSATYAASGSTGDGKITLYSTRISLFGSPILSDFLVLSDRNAPAGYEPVNLFSGGPAVNLNLEEEAYISDTPCYFYFLPSVTYTSGTEYLGGLATVFDVPGVNSTNGLGSVKTATNTLGYQTLFTGNGSEKAEAAIVYTTTYNPYRAIYNVNAASSGDDMGKLFSQTMSYDGVPYSLADRYLVTHQEKIRFDSASKRTNDSRLYVAGIYSGGSPMMVSELYATKDPNGAPSHMAPVSARLSTDHRAVNIGGAFNFKIQNKVASAGVGAIQWIDVTMTPFYLFISGRDYKEGNYITDIFLASKEQVLGGIEMDCDDLDNSYVMNSLAAQGAHTVIEKNLNLEDDDNATYLAYTKKHKSDNATLITPITDLILYYAGETDKKPTGTITKNGILYHLVSDVNIFCEEDGEHDACDRVYLYYTTNPAAGSPVIDIQIDNTAILNGWETVRTQNEKALYDDMNAFERSMWFIHMKRTTEEPKYVSDVVIGVGSSEADAKAVLIAAGCDYMLDKDLNDNVGIHSDYIYLGYKKTSNPDEAIRDLRTTHDNEVDSFVKNGVTYYKIAGNLNSYTNIFADDIFLYYTKDAKAGTPIVSLETSNKPLNSTRDDQYVVSTVVNQKDKSSDLNDGAGGDYIYLLLVRDKNDQNALASMIGNGSVIIIVAFALLSVGGIVWICIAKRKRRIASTAGVEIAANAVTQENTEGDEVV